MVLDDLAELVGIAAIATQRFHQDRDQLGVSSLNSSITWFGSGRWSRLLYLVALCTTWSSGASSAVIATIEMEARRIEMGERERRLQPPLAFLADGRTVEFGQPRLVQCIEGALEGVIVEMTGFNAWGYMRFAGARGYSEKMGDQVRICWLTERNR